MTKKVICSASAKLWIAIHSISTGIGIMLLASCSGQPPELPVPPIPEVEVITVKTQMIPDEPEFIGQTESFRPVEIRAQVSGIIKKVFLPKVAMSKKAISCI